MGTMIAITYVFVVLLSVVVGHSATTSTCSPFTIQRCQHPRIKNATYPTVFGHTKAQATRIISRLLQVIPEVDQECANSMRSFLCALYAPPCVPNIGVAMPPCRRVCQAATRCQKMVTESNFAWRDEWKCAQFPQEGEMCINNKDLKRTGNAPTVATPVSQQIQKTWPDVKPRRYDITDQGSSKLFRGWVDIQGQGAANDYCRIIAGGNRRKQFLACTLAGSTDDAALYVSKRGFDAGHRNSWFMRDMDGDGRDDYCRCVGRGVRSKIYCMKAGLHGFYGGPLQPGNEYTFAVPTSGPCLDKTINPFIGIH